MSKNTYVVTPRCAAAAVVSAVVLRRPTKEYTHPYSMMHRRFPTAGIEVTPHYHQLLVVRYSRFLSQQLLVAILIIRHCSQPAETNSRVQLIVVLRWVDRSVVFILFSSIWQIHWFEGFTAHTLVQVYSIRCRTVGTRCHLYRAIPCWLSCFVLPALCSAAYSSNVYPIVSDIPVQYSQFGSLFARPLYDNIPPPLEPSTLWQPLHKDSYECLMRVLWSACMSVYLCICVLRRTTLFFVPSTLTQPR